MPPAHVWDRIVRVDPRIVDGVLAALLLVPHLGTYLLHPGDDPVLGATLIVAAIAPIALRRVAPVSVLVATATAAAASTISGAPDGLGVPLAVAAGSAASWTERERFVKAVVPISVVAGSVIAADAARPGNWVEFVASLVVTVGVPLMIGRILHHRRARARRDREQAARDAVAAERARIAAELHDVVAHAVSVMVVQAGAARTVVDRDPDAARRALAQIEETGRTGLAELRRLLGILRADGASGELDPQPGLGRLEELLTRVRAAGLPVEATVQGAPRPLAPGVDLTVYRVVQEALTNTMKHAGDAHAHVRVRYDEGAIDVEVADDGTGPGPAADDGHGLLGMRERVALFGGSLDAGERPGGGFFVRARIPTEAHA